MSELIVVKYTDILIKNKSVEFGYNGFHYEVFESADSGYIVNMYGSSDRDEDGCYRDENLIDGGICYGNAMDAIRFMT